MRSCQTYLKLSIFDVFPTSGASFRSFQKKTTGFIRNQWFFGSGRRIRTLTYRVRVCCATLTQSRYFSVFVFVRVTRTGIIISQDLNLSRDILKKAEKFWRMLFSPWNARLSAAIPCRITQPQVVTTGRTGDVLSAMRKRRLFRRRFFARDENEQSFN